MTSALLDEARSLLAAFRTKHDSRDENLVFLPVEVLPDLSRRAANLTKETVLQIVPFTPQDWDPNAYEHLVWRQAASSVNVKRIYVVPHRGLGSEKIAEQVELDAEAGIDASLAFVSDVPADARNGLAGLWILDDCAVVRAGSDSVNSRWTVTARAADLTSARSLWNELDEVASLAETAIPEGVNLEEPLVLSADLMNQVAEVLCTSDHVSEEGCGWYHGSWQYLRLLDLVSTPSWHSDFYLSALRQVFDEKPNPNILISGTADYSVFAFVCAVAAERGSLPRVTVLDRCPTPLFACRWFSKVAGIPVATLAEDVLDSSLEREEGSWDAVVTDAFLTRFESRETAAILELWHSLLSPGGSLVTTIRIHDRSPIGRGPAAAVDDFRARAKNRAERWRPFLSKTPEEIADLSARYASAMVSNDVGSAEGLIASLEASGFQVNSQKLASVPGELSPTTYLEVVCQK